jgi:hypothetical protein
MLGKLFATVAASIFRKINQFLKSSQIGFTAMKTEQFSSIL